MENAGAAGPPGTELARMADLLTPMAIRVMATLRLADLIGESRRTARELAEAANADPDAVDRLLRHLGPAGLVRRDDEGRYELTPLGETLREDHPDGLRRRLDLEGAIGRADLSFVQLLHSARTGQAAFPLQFGRPFWDDLAADPERSTSYAGQMGTDAARWAAAIVGAYDWGSLGHVVDVGGGNGTMLIALLDAHPGLRGTLVDLPGPAGAAWEAFGAAGLAGRADAVAGSFFDPLPAGAGGYLLSAVLHNWDDQAARAILNRCAEAAGATGAVFVVERVGADGESPSTEMDLRVLAYFGGRERGVGALAVLAETAGLHLVAVHPAGSLAVVELSPEGS